MDSNQNMDKPKKTLEDELAALEEERLEGQTLEEPIDMIQGHHSQLLPIPNRRVWIMLAVIFVVIGVAILYVYQAGDRKTVLGNQPIPAAQNVAFTGPAATTMIPPQGIVPLQVQVPSTIGAGAWNVQAGGTINNAPGTGPTAGIGAPQVQCPRCGLTGLPLCAACGSVMQSLSGLGGTQLYVCPACGTVGIPLCPNCGTPMSVTGGAVNHAAMHQHQAAPVGNNGALAANP